MPAFFAVDNHTGNQRGGEHEDRCHEIDPGQRHFVPGQFPDQQGAQQYRGEKPEKQCGIAHEQPAELVIAGQGTIGLEIIEDLPDVDAVIIPVGGGGLISGIAAAIKISANNVSIIGAEPEASPGAYLSMQKGVPCERIPLKPSVADGLAGGLSPLPFEIAHNLIERVALAAEEDIIAAMKAFFSEEQLVVEGAASVGLAALLTGKISLPDQKVVLVLTGRNVAMERFLSIIAPDGVCA